MEQQIFLLVEPKAFNKAYRNAAFCLSYLFQEETVPALIFQKQFRRQLWLPNTGHNHIDNLQSSTWIQAIRALEHKHKLQLPKSLHIAQLLCLCWTTIKWNLAKGVINFIYNISVTMLKNINFMIRYKILKDTDCGKNTNLSIWVISLKLVGCLMYSFLKLNRLHTHFMPCATSNFSLKTI